MTSTRSRLHELQAGHPGHHRRSCHRQCKTDPVATLNLTHRVRWLLRCGGADAEGGGTDGIGCFEEARSDAFNGWSRNTVRRYLRGGEDAATRKAGPKRQ